MTAGGKCLLALGVLLAVTRSAVAQDSLIPVRRDAQVTSVGFRFAGTSSFSDGELGAQLAVKGRGSLYPVRRWLGELPLIPSPGAYRFDPPSKRIRLRRASVNPGTLAAHRVSRLVAWHAVASLIRTLRGATWLRAGCRCRGPR